MLYDQYFIDDLRDRADLVRIIEPYAPLKKKGSNWMGNCPFHQEKTPSFSVNPAKGFYKCFGCGKGGNAYTFLMEMEGLNFPEAIRRIAEMTGTPLPEPVDDEKYTARKKERDERKQIAEQIIELNALAVDFWQSELLADNPKSAAAREYLKQRGISDEVIKQFRVGFAPDSWDAVLGLLRDAGADDTLIEQSGLVSVNEEKDRVYDRFRNRIMFPVLDVDGRPVAFGARAMGDDQPKYLNSPETPAYVKGKHLYGLFNSKEAIRQKKFAILVEGYLDLIALYQFGVTNVVASLGTALTQSQSRLVKRFSKNIVVNYDGDEAGAKAAKKALSILLYDEFNIKVLVLPERLDPDDFIRKYGASEFNKHRAKASSVFDFLLERIPQEYNLTNNQQRLAFIEDVIPICSAFRSTEYGQVHQREFFDSLMSTMRVVELETRKDWWRVVKNKAIELKNSKSTDLNAITLSSAEKRILRAKITVAEQHLLELLIYDRELQAAILPLLEESDYRDLATAPLFLALYDNLEKDRDFSLENIIEYIGDDEFFHDLVPILMMTEPKRQPGEVMDEVFHHAENCVLTLRSMAVANRIFEISQELIAAEQTGNTVLVNGLVEEQLELARMKHDIVSKIREF